MVLTTNLFRLITGWSLTANVKGADGFRGIRTTVQELFPKPKLNPYSNYNSCRSSTLCKTAKSLKEQ